MSAIEFVSRRSTEKLAETVVAIASSKGGIDALIKILSQLPADFSASIAIVQHLSAMFKSHLGEVLDRKTHLQVETAYEGARLTPGMVYVAPPDLHIIINQDGTLSLSDAPKKHFVRPSAEYTFQSLAENYRERAIAVVLTGYDGDGREGVQHIKAMGGRVIVQDRETSKVFDMPETAIKTGCVDLILPIEQIADGIINMSVR